jgi:hypothetical protein
LAPRKPKGPGEPKAANKAPRPFGFRDAQRQVQFATPDVLAAIFEIYGYACAFTGASLRDEAASDPRGYLINLSGDPAATDPTVLIPASIDAIFAFERGHLAVNPHYEFLTNAAQIDPEFAERLNAIGRLRLPADPAFHPSQAALTPHLIAFATGRRRD